MNMSNMTLFHPYLTIDLRIMVAEKINFLMFHFQGPGCMFGGEMPPGFAAFQQQFMGGTMPPPPPAGFAPPQFPDVSGLTPEEAHKVRLQGY